MNNLSAATLQQFRYIAAVSDLESFGGAADALFVSQSALSQGLARLEDLAGMPLFEADGRRRRLTEAGERVARTARRVIADTERLDDDLAARRAGREGTVRVGMIDAAALYLFSGAIARFQRDNHEIDLQITVDGSDECLDRLARFEDDIAIVVGPADGFETFELAEEDMVLLGPGETPDVGATWVMYPEDSNTRSLIDDGLRRLGHHPRVMTESGNPDVLGSMARLNQAWTVLPLQVASSSGLVQGPVVAHRSIVAARRLGQTPSLIVDRFIETLRE